MQQYLEVFELLKSPFLCATAIFALIILLSKANILIKLICIISLVYANILLMTPGQIEQYLGDYSGIVSLCCFLIASVACLISAIRLIKAGVVICCWLAVTAALGVAVFPEIPSEIYSGQEVTRYLHEKTDLQPLLDRVFIARR